MNWEAIGAVGEIVGAAAVVVSMVYLGKQIRNQNRESQVGAMHEISLGFRQSATALLDNGLTELFVKGLKGFDLLTEEEQVRLIIDS